MLFQVITGKMFSRRIKFKHVLYLLVLGNNPNRNINKIATKYKNIAKALNPIFFTCYPVVLLI